MASKERDMNALRQQYGEHLFEKDHDGNYTCFFTECTQQMKSNFQRHVVRHEEQGHRVDAEVADQRKQAFIATRLQMMREQRAAQQPQVGHVAMAARDTGPKRACVHDDHEVLWPDLPRLQSIDAFYSHSTKCKKCYIYLQSERTRRQRSGLPPLPSTVRRSRSSSTAGATTATGGNATATRAATATPAAAATAAASGAGAAAAAAAATSAAAAAAAAALLAEEEMRHDDGGPNLPVEIMFSMYLSAPLTRRSGARQSQQSAQQQQQQQKQCVGDALLLLPHVSAPPVAAAGASMVGLRHAAMAACYGRAIVAELREHPYVRGARAELDRLDVDVEQGSLRQLEEALCKVLLESQQRNAGKVESAELQQLLVHVRARIQDARAGLRHAGQAGGGGVCGQCGVARDPSPGSGAPVCCAGVCGRVFHASCAGTPDESGWQCEQCRMGVPVAHYDERRGDWFVLAPADETGAAAAAPKTWDSRGPFAASRAPPAEGRTLGKLVRAARRNDAVASAWREMEEEMLASGGKRHAGARPGPDGTAANDE